MTYANKFDGNMQGKFGAMTEELIVERELWKRIWYNQFITIV
jgi:hypothetical protein